MHIEHIDPAGGDTLDNLCLSCANCNLIKGKATTGIDPVTRREVPLFNPRKQLWAEHFAWLGGGLYLRGRTAIGRASVSRLKMNLERVLIARSRWIAGGFHPPD